MAFTQLLCLTQPRRMCRAVPSRSLCAAVMFTLPYALLAAMPDRCRSAFACCQIMSCSIHEACCQCNILCSSAYKLLVRQRQHAYSFCKSQPPEPFRNSPCTQKAWWTALLVYMTRFMSVPGLDTNIVVGLAAPEIIAQDSNIQNYSGELADGKPPATAAARWTLRLLTPFHSILGSDASEVFSPCPGKTKSIQSSRPQKCAFVTTLTMHLCAAVWSLGVMLYVKLFYKYPFEEKGTGTVSCKVLQQIERVRQLQPHPHPSCHLQFFNV